MRQAVWKLPERLKPCIISNTRDSDPINPLWLRALPVSGWGYSFHQMLAGCAPSAFAESKKLLLRLL